METELDTYGSGSLSTDITLSASVDSAEINQYLSDSSVVLRLDVDQGNLLANGDLILMGSPVLSGSITYDNGRLGFCLPELDDNYYVMDLSKMLASMGVESVNLDNIKLPEFSGKEWRALAEAYLDVAYTMVTKDNVKVAQRQSYTLPELGGSYTGTIYTFTPTAADIQAMLVKLADHLEKDKDLRSLILKVVDPETLLLSMSGFISADAYYNDPAAYDFESVLDEACGSWPPSCGKRRCPWTSPRTSASPGLCIWRARNCAWCALKTAMTPPWSLSARGRRPRAAPRCFIMNTATMTAMSIFKTTIPKMATSTTERSPYTTATASPAA